MAFAGTHPDDQIVRSKLCQGFMPRMIWTV
jgi:hypothetical protein